MDRLFRTLGARLAAARHVDRELDRVLANRFNPLDYLRTDELGLSRILGDLLDPHAAHGQGSAFLLRFLEKLGPHLPGGSLLAFERASVDTVCERSIGCAGRLDVSIEIKDGEQEPVCIAIENKPYAADGDGQVDAYLRFLRCRYPGRFLLIYLSPHGGPPSTESLPERASTQGLATLSYCPQAYAIPERDEETLQLPFALTDWLRECGLSCTVDRLRSFLRDIENFCHKTFGGVLTTDTEHREVRDFILESEDNLRTTLTVLGAYPKVRNEVVTAFLRPLRENIERELQLKGDFLTGYKFSDKPGSRDEGLWAWRSSWEGEESTPYIWLGHDRRDAAWWWLGVGFDPVSGDHPDSRIESLRKPLANRLGIPHARAAKFPWYRYLDEAHRDWAPLLVRMHQEATQPGALIEHFSSQFVNLAREAMDDIDRVSVKQ